MILSYFYLFKVASRWNHLLVKLLAEILSNTLQFDEKCQKLILYVSAACWCLLFFFLLICIRDLENAHPHRNGFISGDILYDAVVKHCIWALGLSCTLNGIVCFIMIIFLNGYNVNTMSVQQASERLFVYNTIVLLPLHRSINNLATIIHFHVTGCK